MSILVMSFTTLLLLLISGVTSIDLVLGTKDRGNLEKSYFKTIVNLMLTKNYLFCTLL